MAQSPDQLADVYMQTLPRTWLSHKPIIRNRITIYLEQPLTSSFTARFTATNVRSAVSSPFGRTKCPRRCMMRGGCCSPLSSSPWWVRSWAWYPRWLTSTSCAWYWATIMWTWRSKTFPRDADGPCIAVGGNADVSQHHHQQYHGGFHHIRHGTAHQHRHGWYLFRNGIMLGSFEAFFYQHGCWASRCWRCSCMAHWRFRLSSWLVRQAYHWATVSSFRVPILGLGSFQRGAKRGLKIAVGTVPIFITAGFIEDSSPDIPRCLMPSVSAWYCYRSHSWYFIMWFGLEGFITNKKKQIKNSNLWKYRKENRILCRPFVWR